MRYIGLLVVIGAVLGGFVLSGGSIPVLIQPYECLVILGAASGTLLIGLLPHQLKAMQKKTLGVFGGSKYSMAAANEMLQLLFHLAIVVKKEGVIALESHIRDPEQSAIFSKYPTVLKNHHALHFITDALRLQVDGAVAPEELAAMLERTLDTHHEEETVVPGALQKMGDALPGLGIVAAVLGIIITMSHLDGPPEEIGHHVAVALVGTFLGILMSYGFVQPIVAAMEQENRDEGNYFEAVRIGLCAFAEGKAPVVVVEMARSALYSYNQPTRETVEEACKALRAA